MIKEKRVTLLIGSLAGGGAEGVCVTLANGLSRNGWQVTLVVLNLENAVNLTRVDGSVEIVNLNVSRVRWAFFSLFRYFVNKKNQPVLVFDHLLSVVLIFLNLMFRLNLKVICRNINTLSEEMNRYSGFFYGVVIKRAVNLLYSKADYIINQSQGMMNDLVSLYPAVRNKTTYIYNPVAERFSKACQTYPERSERNYFLCIGRLEKQKAFHYALDAFAMFLKENPDFRLKMVGDGSLRQSLVDKCSELNISGSVDFLGFQADTIELYRNARAVLLTSLYEGFPNVLVESLTVGTPVVSFDCQSGPSELIVDGVNGFLVKYKDIDDLLFKLLLAYDFEFDYAAVSESVRSFSSERVSNMYSSILIEVVA